MIEPVSFLPDAATRRAVLREQVMAMRGPQHGKRYSA